MSGGQVAKNCFQIGGFDFNKTVDVAAVVVVAAVLVVVVVAVDDAAAFNGFLVQSVFSAMTISI